MEELFFENLKRHVGFTPASMEALRSFYQIASPHFSAVADDLYEAILSHPDASAVFGGTSDRARRVKQTIVRWLDSLLTGPHDQSYFQARARIGHAHVRLKLPQAYIVTAINRVRVRLLEVLRENIAGTVEVRRIANALHQILDLDLAVMLETYRDDLVARTRRVERLATIGEFAASIGHELRNPLAVIDSSLFIIGQRFGGLLKENPDLAKHLSRTASEAQRSIQTVRDLSNLARGRAPQCQVVPLRRLVDGAAALTDFPPGVSLLIRVPEDVSVNVDVGQMAHVIVNLLTNAVQAMKAGGTIVVEAQARSAEAIRFRVTDDGPGIPAEIRDRIFDPLFTTKEQGSGLGLALSRRIVEAHGGTIEVEPSPSGASIAILLPTSESGSIASRVAT